MTPEQAFPPLVQLPLNPQQAQQAKWQQAIANLVSPYAASLSPAYTVLAPQALAAEALTYAPLFWVAVEESSLSTEPVVWAASYVALMPSYPSMALLHGVSRAMPNTTRPYKHPQQEALANMVLHAACHPVLGLRLLLVEMDDPQSCKRNLGALGFCRRYGFKPLHRMALPHELTLPEPLEGCVLWGLFLHSIKASSFATAGQGCCL